MEMSDGVLLALIGFGGGLLLGLAARLGRFCTLGAVEDALYGGSTMRLRAWALALSLSILLVHAGAALGLVDFSSSIYAALAWSPAASILGGLAFGYGMALAGNCGYGALARLGGGDLRAFVVVIVMGLAAAMTIGGPLASLRAGLFPSVPAEGAAFGAADGLFALAGIPPLLTAALVSAALAIWALSEPGFRRSRRLVLSAVAVALAIASGWVGTSLVAAESFAPLRAASHTFTAPLGESLFWLMTSSAGGLSFGVGSVAGVLAGAFFGSVRRGHFRWEACDDPRELGRQMFGGALMGVGGVVALGCSVGQGLTAFSALAWSAPVTMAAIAAGAALGLRQLIHGFSSFGRG